jgi:hypothetical protein
MAINPEEITATICYPANLNIKNACFALAIAADERQKAYAGTRPHLTCTNNISMDNPFAGQKSTI